MQGLQCTNFFPTDFVFTSERHHYSQVFGGTQRRCSAKYLFRSGSSAGWQVFYFHRLRLGIFYNLCIFSRAGWIGRETGGDWKRPRWESNHRWPKKSHMQKKPILSGLSSRVVFQRWLLAVSWFSEEEQKAMFSRYFFICMQLNFPLFCYLYSENLMTLNLRIEWTYSLIFYFTDRATQWTRLKSKFCRLSGFVF